MRRFLPKCTSSSAASSSPKPAATQQPAKPTPTTPEPRSDKARQGKGDREKGWRINTKSSRLGCYAMHGCGSRPSATDGNSHPQLPWWLDHSGPVRGRFNIAQDPPPQPLMLPGAQGQLCQEYTVTHPTSIIPGHSYPQCPDDSRWQQLSRRSEPRRFSAKRLPSEGTARPLKAFQKMLALWQQLRQYFVGSTSHAPHPVLAEAEGSTCGLASRMPPRNSDSGLCISPGP